MDKQNIIIIGGSSYIGLQLADFLQENNTVTATYRNTCVFPKKISSVKLDLYEKNCFDVLGNKVFDTMIWCAQSTNYSQSIENFDSMFNVNVAGMQKALEYCKKNNIKHLVYLSSGTVYENLGVIQRLNEQAEITQKSFYGLTKYMAERLCNQYASEDLKITVLRPFSVYGKNQNGKLIPRIWQKIINKQPVVLNQGIGMYFTALYVVDLIKAIAYVIANPTKQKIDIYNIANEEIISLKDVCHKIAKIENIELNIQYSNDEINYSIADIEKIKSVLPGFNYTSIDDGLMSMSQRLVTCAE